MHYTNKKKILSFPSCLRFPCQAEGLTVFHSSSRGRNDSWYSLTVCQSEVFTSVHLLCLSSWLKLKGIYLPCSPSLSKSLTDTSLLETSSTEIINIHNI